MSSSTRFRVLSLAAALLFVAFAPISASAQRGGGHGGGGFHGGGGGWHGSGGWQGGGWQGGGSGWQGGGAYHGGGYYGGGYHGGGGYYRGGYPGGYYGGWRGGYYGGWRGGYWGYPAYGWGWGSGWGFSVSIDLGSDWPAYDYAPAYVVPYPYYNPYYYPYGYYSYAAPASSAPANYVGDDPPVQNQSTDPYTDGNAQDNLPPQTSAPATQHYPPSSHWASSQQSARSAPVTNNYSRRTPQQLPPLSPEVQNAVRALRAMPPYAREQQLSRYGNLTPEQVSIVRQIVGMP